MQSAVRILLLCATTQLALSACDSGRSREGIQLNICRECDLRIEHVVTIQGHDSLGGISPTPTLVRLPTGEYAASNYFDMGRILVFDSLGNATRTIGRKGGGPGEFNSIQIFKEWGGKLYAYDRINSRITEMDPDGAVVREVRLGIPITNLVPTDGGGFVVGAELRSRAEVGLPLHILDSTGAIVRSFGDSTGAYAAGLRGLRMRRALRTMPDGSLWSARLGEHILEQWNDRSELIQRLARDVDWFPPMDPMRRITLDPEVPPQPRIMDFSFDQDGRLWLLVGYPADNWKEVVAPSSRRGPGGIQLYRTTRADGLFSTIIEVIDPTRREVILLRRYSPTFARFLDSEHVYSYDESPDGVVRYQVWKLSLHQPDTEEIR